ncbi:MAG: sodium/proline symporter [Clostridiales bacterium]|nr:sodium/proline symporter [Candidatus Equinaster intestinalis]
MTGDNIQHLIAIIVYMLAVVGIGIFFAKRANKNAESYFLGGRTLGPWVSAFSAEASDMSGWLLMGLPGLAYWTGLADAGWTAIGLFVGTYFNWLIVSKRLRRYSVQVDAITLPGFFSKRFREKNNIILIIASLFIIIFFTVYAGQCLASCGKLFENLFGLGYHEMMIIAAIFVLFYTFLGGFLAESASDFMQAVVMVIALVIMFALGISKAGGIGAVIDNAKSYDGFLSLFRTSTPSADTVNTFGEGKTFGAIGILSALAWGLGYFGMPQVLLRFMGIRSEKELTRSRRVACIWLFIAMGTAVFIGVVGRSVADIGYTSNAAAESIFMDMATSFLPPVLAGLACAGILAASISSSDSYLLISTSALAENIFHGVIKKNSTDKQVLWVSRISMAIITIIAMIIAWDSNSTIFSITSFAWAGFGATFGPLMLFSLFWKKTTHAGAVSGMVAGGAMVFIWKLLIKPLGGIFGVYELLPAFIISSIFIVAVSLLTKNKDEQIEADFDAVAQKQA